MINKLNSLTLPLLGRSIGALGFSPFDLVESVANLIQFTHNLCYYTHARSTEGAGGGIACGGVTAREIPGVKDVGLGFAICCGADP